VLDRNYSVESVSLDVGVVERGPLEIDLPATRRSLADLSRCAEQVIAAEVRHVQDTQPALIAADIPFLAGHVGRRAGVPCVAIGNFTWDWIYEPFLNSDAEASRLLEFVRSGYREMAMWLRLPFGHDESAIPGVTDMPLVVERGSKTREEIRARIGLSKSDPRTVVFLGMRGGVENRVLETAASAAPDFVFLHRLDAFSHAPSNTRYVQVDGDLTFVDVMDASDAVVSKLGYGMLAQSIASQTALVFPPRSGFREDELLEAAAARLLRSRKIARTDYYSGNWGDALRDVTQMNAPTEECAVNGAEACAAAIRELLASV
jgi:hypothetical protein